MEHEKNILSEKDKKIEEAIPEFVEKKEIKNESIDKPKEVKTPEKRRMTTILSPSSVSDDIPPSPLEIETYETKKTEVQEKVENDTIDPPTNEKVEEPESINIERKSVPEFIESSENSESFLESGEEESEIEEEMSLEESEEDIEEKMGPKVMGVVNIEDLESAMIENFRVKKEGENEEKETMDLDEESESDTEDSKVFLDKEDVIKNRDIGEKAWIKKFVENDDICDDTFNERYGLEEKDEYDQICSEIEREDEDEFDNLSDSKSIIKNSVDMEEKKQEIIESIKEKEIKKIPEVKEDAKIEIDKVQEKIIELDIEQKKDLKSEKIVINKKIQIEEKKLENIDQQSDETFHKNVLKKQESYKSKKAISKQSPSPKKKKQKGKKKAKKTEKVQKNPKEKKATVFSIAVRNEENKIEIRNNKQEKKIVDNNWGFLKTDEKSKRKRKKRQAKKASQITLNKKYSNLLAENTSNTGSTKQVEIDMDLPKQDLIVSDHIKVVPKEDPEKLEENPNMEGLEKPIKKSDLLIGEEEEDKIFEKEEDIIKDEEIIERNAETTKNIETSKGEEGDWVNFKKGEGGIQKVSIKKKLFAFMETKIDKFLFNIDDRIGKHPKSLIDRKMARGSPPQTGNFPKTCATNAAATRQSIGEPQLPGIFHLDPLQKLHPVEANLELHDGRKTQRKGAFHRHRQNNGNPRRAHGQTHQLLPKANRDNREPKERNFRVENGDKKHVIANPKHATESDANEQSSEPKTGYDFGYSGEKKRRGEPKR